MPPSATAIPFFAPAGWITSVVVGAYLSYSAGAKFLRTPAAAAEFHHLGYPESVIVPIGIAQAVAVLLYLIPQTGTLGAAMITAYMGGGTAVHLRAGDPVIIPIATGVLAWAGLVLRDRQVRAVMPWKTALTHTVPEGTANHRSSKP